MTSAVLGLALAMSGCALVSIAERGQPSYQCPVGRPLVTLDELDLSGASRSRPLLTQRLNVIQSDAERAAYCQGRFSAIAFSSSTAANAVVYDAVLSPSGATQIARNRVIPGLVKSVMDSVRSNVQAAMTNLPSNATDLTAAFVLGTDQIALHGRGAAVRITILTNGITTTGPAQINTPGLTIAQAVAAADEAPPANLTGADVLIEGIGTVAGSVQPPSDYVASVRAYARELCRRSHAASCQETTEVAAP